MATKQKLDFVTADDWQGLYINSKLVLENHSLDWRHILDALDIEYDNDVIDEKWMEENGRLPKDLKDVKLEK